MSIHLQIKSLAVIHELVGYTEVEDAFGRGQYFGLHAILGNGTIEVLLKHGISLWHLSVALSLVNCSTDEAVLAYSFSQALRKNCLRCQKY